MPGENEGSKELQKLEDEQTVATLSQRLSEKQLALQDAEMKLKNAKEELDRLTKLFQNLLQYDAGFSKEDSVNLRKDLLQKQKYISDLEFLIEKSERTFKLNMQNMDRIHKTIVEAEETIVEAETKITDLENDLSKAQALIEQQNETLADQDATIAAQNQVISDQQQELEQANSTIMDMQNTYISNTKKLLADIQNNILDKPWEIAPLGGIEITVYNGQQLEKNVNVTRTAKKILDEIETFINKKNPSMLETAHCLNQIKNVSNEGMNRSEVYRFFRGQDESSRKRYQSYFTKMETFAKTTLSCKN